MMSDTTSCPPPPPPPPHQILSSPIAPIGTTVSHAVPPRSAKSIPPFAQLSVLLVSSVSWQMIVSHKKGKWRHKRSDFPHHPRPHSLRQHVVVPIHRRLGHATAGDIHLHGRERVSQFYV